MNRKRSVGGDCYHTILNSIFKIKLYIYYLLEVGAMAIAPYGCFKNQKGQQLVAQNEAGLNGFYFMPMLLNGALENSTLRNFFKIQKHYNLSYFSQKLFFNVKIVKKL